LIWSNPKGRGAPSLLVQNAQAHPRVKERSQPVSQRAVGCGVWWAAGIHTQRANGTVGSGCSGRAGEGRGGGPSPQQQRTEGRGTVDVAGGEGRCVAFV
jgi:hypothetical protein